MVFKTKQEAARKKLRFVNPTRRRHSDKTSYESGIFAGQRADFLRAVAFWSISYSGLLRWFCVTGAAQHFAEMHGMEKSQQHW